MTTLAQAVDAVLAAQAATGKPLSVVLAGHNGSGKSTMWYEVLADRIRVPLVNADRMMMSVLPEPDMDGHLPSWASLLRDGDRSWMAVAQQGVQAFVSHAMGAKVPFATETVFSHWQDLGGGRFASKLDLIRNMQEAGYFVLLMFVGLRDAELSILRVRTRVLRGGHGIAAGTLRAVPKDAAGHRGSSENRRRFGPGGQQPGDRPSPHGVPGAAWGGGNV